MNLSKTFLFYDFTRDIITEHLSHSYEEILYYLYFVMIAERVILTIRGVKDNLKDSLTSVCHGIFYEIVRLSTYSSQLYLYGQVYSYTAKLFKFQENFWLWINCLLVMDFIYYWNHRLNHEIHFLWAFHQVHHSSEQYNYTIAMRQSAVEHLHNFIFYVPAAVFFPPTYIMRSLHVIALYHMLLHTELGSDIRSLDWIFNMPKYHRIHHGCNKFCIDKNYGGILIIWDRMFNTFQIDRPNTKVHYGLPVSPTYYNIYYQQAFGVLQLIEKMRDMKSVDKLYSIVMGPRWYPDAPRLGYNHQKKLRSNHIKASKIDWNEAIFIYMFTFTLIMHHSEIFFIKERNASRMMCTVINSLVTFFACGLLCDGVNFAKIALIENCHWIWVMFVYPTSPLTIIKVYKAIWHFYAFYCWMVILSCTRILLITHAISCAVL